MQELTITETVDRIVRCDPGFRFPTDEEHEAFTAAGKVPAGLGWQWNSSYTDIWHSNEGSGWAYGKCGSKFYHRHHFRIAVPVVTAPEGFELVTDPSYRTVIGVDKVYDPHCKQWETAKFTETVSYWNQGESSWKVARPIHPPIPKGYRLGNPAVDKGKKFAHYATWHPDMRRNSWDMSAEPHYPPQWYKSLIYIVKDLHEGTIAFDRNGVLEGPLVHQALGFTRDQVAGGKFKLTAERIS